MEIETWHLLALPVFFALGWLAARVDMRQVVRESRAVPASYFKGLNHLLNEQPDRAIEAFVEVARLDPDTLELHFALGALFRRRGELERAIRIHQNLVDRADLKQDQRLKALNELGEDFLKAGLLDRAEAIFKRLQTGPHALDALRRLLDIHVLGKDWEQAIVTARRLEKMGASVSNAEIAHYHCELAQQALLRQDAEAARAQIEAALAIYPRSARAYQLKGDLAAQLGDDRGAIAAWRALETENPAYLPLVAERLMRAYTRLDQTEAGMALLRAYHALHPTSDLFEPLFQITAERQGWAAAVELAGEALRRTPSLRVVDDYLQARTAAAGEETELELRIAQDVVHRQANRLAYYRCARCGFRARQHFWQCPACAAWDSLPPNREESEYA